MAIVPTPVVAITDVHEAVLIHRALQTEDARLTAALINNVVEAGAGGESGVGAGGGESNGLLRAMLVSQIEACRSLLKRVEIAVVAAQATRDDGK